jgi:hypothetical protein
MNANANTAIRPVTSPDISARVDAIDWARATADLDAQGCAVLKSLLTGDECRALAALYGDDARFRSRIVMGRHGFGRGEYKYFAYPLPDMIAALRPALYARLQNIANRWNEAMGIDIRYPESHAAFLKRCRRPEPADPAAAAIWSRRLQLPASGSLRRACVSIAGGDPAVGTGARFHRRRVRADRAAPAHAVAPRSRSAGARRCGRLCCACQAGAGDARQLPR